MEKVVIINLIIILGDLPLDLGLIHPGDEILHVPGDMEGRVLNSFRPHTDMALLDQGDGLPQRFRHLQVHQDDGEAAPAERRDGGPGELGEGIRRWDQAGIVELVEELLADLATERVLGLQQRDLVCHLRNISTNFIISKSAVRNQLYKCMVVPGVVFTVLYVVSTHHLGFIRVVGGLPLEEVDLLQELLLMILELPGHFLKNSTLVKSAFLVELTISFSFCS